MTPIETFQAAARETLEFEFSFQETRYGIEQVDDAIAAITALALQLSQDVAREVIGEDDKHLLDYLDTAGIKHKFDRPLWEQVSVVRNNLRAAQLARLERVVGGRE